MNAEVFAAWIGRQGYRVVRTPSSYWYEAGAGVFQAFPYHWTISPAKEELACLFWEHRALALRYSTPISAPAGKISYHVVRDGCYEWESLTRQTRQNITKGLQYTRVEPISLARLAGEGWSGRLDTLCRQGREGAETQEQWRRMCQSAEGLPGFVAWGAIHDGALVASCLTLRCERCLTVPYEQSATQHLPHRPNNALFYFVTREALNCADTDQLFLCLESLDAPESVDEFKFRMGFSARPVRQRVVFHPLLAPFVNAATHALLRKTRSRYPGKPVLAKAEGMMRFYLQGKQPAARQNWPPPLAGRRDELLAGLA